MSATAIEGRRIYLRGTVQGVGMRPWIYRLAREHGINGRVRNEAGGVVIEAFAPHDALDRFLAALGRQAPPAAVIDALESAEIPGEAAATFVIVESGRAELRRVSIPPDLATCAECAAEILDPLDRRYRYPFTNCTNCGPRFTIATDIPYDRPATTMGGFPMCPACAREYRDPADRRFHAQPNACPVCGPTLVALDASGRPLPVPDPIRFAAEQLAAGRIVALKGLGGFHLACDATSAVTVARLRARKHRDEKPLAIMVRDLATAEALVEMSEEARALLTSVERPIVLLPARTPQALIAAEVAPGNPLLGVMLPYTPLHHLLLADYEAPLVMTSANLAEEPIVCRNDDAVRRLGGIADLLLVHDREIVTRCDDSVAAVIAGRPMLLRRSRGFVPRPIQLKTPVEVPVLATGALLKNTFCLAAGGDAWLGPHVGDLENAETYEAYQEAIDRMERFVGFRGEVIAHDLHPDYLSTRYARERAPDACVGVQHHHAHVVSAMAEHGIDGPVLGLAFDGTGLGPDTTAWGGEFLIADRAGYQRVATFRPVRLAGGDTAIRQPWRIALAMLTDALGADFPFRALPLFAAIPEQRQAIVRQMLEGGVNAPPAHGVGRYFDGIGALLLVRPESRYEGQVAFLLNMAADPAERSRYPFVIDHRGEQMTIDLRPCVRDAVRDVIDGISIGDIAGRFHNTLVAASAAVVREVVQQHESLPVVLTGGCFQNARLAEGIRGALWPRVDVYLHARVPPGDGGIALGQAVVAAAAARR